MKWEEFIEYLSNNINWDNPTEDECRKVEGALKAIAQSPGEVKGKLKEIVESEELFDAYKSHNQYPRITMDKFMLHMDPNDNFRVRLHRFKSLKNNGESVPKIHSHKWVYSTIILAGSYTENIWKVAEVDDKNRKANLEFKGSYILKTGDTNSGLLDYAHQTINSSPNDHCITLFVRGKSLQKGAKIFDIENNSFQYTFSPDKQLKEAYKQLSEYNFDFLP